MFELNVECCAGVSIICVCFENSWEKDLKYVFFGRRILVSGKQPIKSNTSSGYNLTKTQTVKLKQWMILVILKEWILSKHLQLSLYM